MLNIYLHDDISIEKFNDVYFNKFTFSNLDINIAREVVKSIDGVILQDNKKFVSKITGGEVALDCLSTGCKTVLNVIFNSNKIFSAVECGTNALYYIYKLRTGSIYLDNLLLPSFEDFDVDICVIDKNKQEHLFKNTLEAKSWYGGYKNEI